MDFTKLSPCGVEGPLLKRRQKVGHPAGLHWSILDPALGAVFLAGEYKANMLVSVAMARRRDRDEPPDVLSAEEIKELRHRIAHLSPEGVRRLYDRAFEDCR
jgi:hypothetical protein